MYTHRMICCMLPLKDIFYGQTCSGVWPVYRGTHMNTLGTHSLLNDWNWWAVSECSGPCWDLNLWKCSYRTWFTDVYTAFMHTHAPTCRHTRAHTLSILPVMDDEGPVPGIGELGTDGQDDLLLRWAQSPRVTPQCSLDNGCGVHTLVFCTI